MEESTQQREQGIVAWEVLYDQYDVETKPTQNKQFILQGRLSNPIAFAASVDPDIMYYHQAMKEPDHEQFRRSVLKEIHNHETNQHLEVIPAQNIPPNTKVLDMVWTMRRKRRIDTRQVYKWKARHNVHGGQQEHGVNFWETYAPVVSWQTLRLFFIHSILKGWHSKQMDFVLAYPHAPAEVPSYMRFPKGYEFKDRISEDTHALKITKNIYGQKQAGRVWNKYLDEGLGKISFKPSKMGPCLYFCGHIALLVYIDDCIMFSPDMAELDKVVEEMRTSSKKFRVEDLGNVKDFLGIQVMKGKDKTITLNQPQLIGSILKDVKFQSIMKEKDTLALSSVLLQKDTQDKPFNNDFHYQRVIGKLNFLEKSTRPDISYAVHQGARFCEHPKQSHGKAVRRLCRHLKATRDKGIICNPANDKSYECWVDANLAGGFDRRIAGTDPTTSNSRSGWAITYAGCPIAWASKLQALTALSTTEAEYIALSTACRELIPMLEFTKEMRSYHIKSHPATPKIHCKIFEDNSGAIKMARTPKICPCTKHTYNAYHLFCEYTQPASDGAKPTVEIVPVSTEEQLGDMLTKPLPAPAFIKFHKTLLGWSPRIASLR